MVFSSLIFIFIFFPIIYFGNLLISRKYRNIFLLIASLFFYSFGEPKYIFLMLFSILVNYVFGLLIEDKSDKKKLWLVLDLIINLGLLGYFKYFDFLISTINSIFKCDIAKLNIALPIGISFYTFQSISYIMDLYRGKYKAQRSLLNLALYICLFPQLIAGPIVRYVDVNEQILDRDVTVEKSAEGIKRFIIGLSKKVLIANTLALPVSYVYSLPVNSISIYSAWLAPILTGLYIYYDFSGYSDMAIGLGKMLGFDFMENFNYPFIQRTVTEFWRDWHISLSSWFRDYLYIPLGGSRRGNVYVNLFIIFLATGIWHGAAWNFVMWGVWNGIFIIIEKAFLFKHLKKNKILTFIYFSVVTAIGFIIFEAGISKAIPFAYALLNPFRKLSDNYYSLREIYDNKVLLTTFIGLLGCGPLLPLFRKIDKLKYYDVFQFVACIVMFIACIMMLSSGTYNPFIYFRF